MNNPFFENFSQLRKEWKTLRSELTAELSDQQQLEKVAKWWSRAPVTRDWLNWDDPATWPDPWELIATKNLDNSAISLGIGYTLILGQDARWTTDRVSIRLVCDRDRTMQHLVVDVDQKFVLNFDYAMVSELDDRIVTNSIYHYDGKRFHEVRV